ncbi:MAG: hypothetical protein KC620_02665 [Myxococcales bacterium]|nr:hypothetical protein [Myxococcales bacterium]
MANPAVERAVERLQGIKFTRFILPGLALILVMTSLGAGSFGFVEVQPGEVAVVYNATGLSVFGEPAKVVRDQGTLTYMPFFQRVEILEIDPQVMVMEGKGEAGDPNQVSLLTVRAIDGSNFYFERMEIHYQVLPGSADVVIANSGRGGGYKNRALAVHSREILRNEFGRYSFLEVAKPSTYGKATALAKTKLNERLNPLGIMVTQIITPKPRFQEKVETAIEERQNAEQEVQVQKEKRNRLKAQSQRMVQDVEQQMNAEYQGLVAQLEGDRRSADNQAIAVKREADKYAIDTVASCTAYRDQKVKLASANEVAYRKQAEGLAAKIRAVGARGADVLNLEIAEHDFPQLGEISATPYAPPATPVDIRYLNSGDLK